MTSNNLQPEVISIQGLRRAYRHQLALDQVNLTVSPGCVFGLVGENGAGKTTLIKHLLGLLKPQAGMVRVLGRDPVADPEGVLARVGYLSETRDLPDYLSVEEFLRYTQSFYPSWDMAYAQALCRDFELVPAARLRRLSQGQRARAGLVAALAFRPELLILDEPSGGLDPMVRRDILEAIVRTVAGEGRTVFFSSHLLDEVERVADHVGMLSGGRLALCGALDEVKAVHRQYIVRFDSPPPRPPAPAGALSCEGEGKEWCLVGHGPAEGFRAAVARTGGRIVEERELSLNDIFLARCQAPRSGLVTAEK
jgi:ABC-2 type transport system ATP-binding protein